MILDAESSLAHARTRAKAHSRIRSCSWLALRCSSAPPFCSAPVAISRQDRAYFGRQTTPCSQRPLQQPQLVAPVCPSRDTKKVPPVPRPDLWVEFFFCVSIHATIPRFLAALQRSSHSVVPPASEQASKQAGKQAGKRATTYRFSMNRFHPARLPQVQESAPRPRTTSSTSPFAVYGPLFT